MTTVAEKEIVLTVPARPAPPACFGDFVRCIVNEDRNRLRSVYKAAMAESGGLTGGYAVPPEYSTGLLTSIAEKAIMRKRAFVQPMKSKTMQLGVPDFVTLQAAGTTPFGAGLKMGWGAELQTETETEPTLRQLELTAWELSGYAVVSNPWLDDAVENDAWLRKLIIDACAWYEDFAFLQGTGAGQPTGLLNCACAIAVSRATASQIQLVDVAKMAAKLPPSSMMRAMWIVTETGLAQLLQLNDGTGRAMWIPNDGVQNLAERSGYPLGSLMGLPVYCTEKLPALGTKGDLVLVDPQLYVIGNREEILIDVSREATLAIFQKNQSVIRVVRRADGQPAIQSAITLQDGVTTVSPIVILQ
jgi:HK97 family phage major capsid protein